jgi:nitrogen fixation NifU-like protein
MYSAQLLDHFQNPRNPGVVQDANVSVEVQNPVCGDVLQMTMRIVEDRIAEVRFLAKGCVPAMACASALMELISGKNLDEARRLVQDELIQAVGGLPNASIHASQLALDALRQALKKWNNLVSSSFRPIN